MSLARTPLQSANHPMARILGALIPDKQETGSKDEDSSMRTMKNEGSEKVLAVEPIHNLQFVPCSGTLTPLIMPNLEKSHPSLALIRFLLNTGPRTTQLPTLTI